MRNVKMYIVLLCSYFVIIFIFSGEMKLDTINKRYSNLNYYGEVGTWVYFGDDVLKTIQEFVPLNKKKMIKSIEQFKESRQIVAYDFAEQGAIQNIILIQLEGIDAISLELQYNGQDVMPNLNMLKKNSIYFENAYDQTGSGRTSDGEFLALTSLLPVANESMYLNYELEHVISLPQILDAHDFQTISIHGFEGAFYNRKSAHRSLGYEESFFLEDLQEEAVDSDYLGWGLSDRFILNKIYELIKETDKKTFIHAILLSNHHPFDAVSQTCDDLIIDNPKNIVEDYLNSVRYTDLMIGQLLENLQKLDVMDKTLLVIFSDHDSGITEQIYDYFNMEYNDLEAWKYDKVPLIFHCGNNIKNDKTISGQADIMPLILSYLEIDIPETCMGLNYINEKKVVYKQTYNIYDEEMEATLMNMDTVTKSVVFYSEQ